MFSFLSELNPKVYFVTFAVFVVVLVGGYIGYLEYKLKNKEIELIKKEQKIKETNDDLVEQKQINDLTIKGYEQTLKVEKEIADEKAIALEQKIEVTKTTNKVKEAVIKRGEIKQDEKSNFTIVTF
jgi:hypothetical protein